MPAADFQAVPDDVTHDEAEAAPGEREHVVPVAAEALPAAGR